MNKQLVLCVAALAFGLSACHENPSPTGVGRDLLNNPNNVPLLKDSKYGQVLDDIGDIESPEPDPIPDPTLGYHIAAGPLTSQYTANPYWHILTGDDVSSYKTRVHEPDGANKTQYSYAILQIPYVHKLTGPDKTKRGLIIHALEGADKTVSKISLHIAEGVNKSQWYYADDF